MLKRNRLIGLTTVVGDVEMNYVHCRMFYLGLLQITQKDREDRRSLPAPYIGADVNREISHEARKHRGDKFAVEMHDVDSWPFDPNLTCSFCGRMFRRGQIRDFRYHVDDCTARSMEERK